MPNLLGANVQLNLRHTEMSILGSALGCMLPGQAMNEKDKSREMMEALYQLLEFPWRRKWLPTPVFLPGEFHEQRSLVGRYSSWGCKEFDRTEWLTLSLFFFLIAPSFWGTMEDRIGWYHPNYEEAGAFICQLPWVSSWRLIMVVLILQKLYSTVCVGRVGSGRQRKPSSKERHKLAAAIQINMDRNGKTPRA